MTLCYLSISGAVYIFVSDFTPIKQTKKEIRIIIMRCALSHKTFLTIPLMTAFMGVTAQGRYVVTFQSSHTESYVHAYVSDAVDVMPQFPGGENELMNYINRERMYPREAYDKGISGRVQCSFVVAPDGSIHEVSVFRGVHPSLDREAIRIISNMPRWTPGSISGENVPVFYMLTIPFRR